MAALTKLPRAVIEESEELQVSIPFFFFFYWKNPLIYVSAMFKLVEGWGGGDNNLSWPFPNDKWLDAVIHSFFLFLFLFFTRRLSITIPRATITVIMIPKILNRTFLVVLSVIEVTVVFAGKKKIDYVQFSLVLLRKHFAGFSRGLQSRVSLPAILVLLHERLYALERLERGEPAKGVQGV